LLVHNRLDFSSIPADLWQVLAKNGGDSIGRIILIEYGSYPEKWPLPTSSPGAVTGFDFI
jgi:hypothetical protein